ncbi:MAG: ABC transporter permease [Candidatus Buchananbacteria bacterium]
MDLIGNLNLSYKNLTVNKTRTLLTMLGLIIGISSVIIIMSVGAGAQSLVLNQVKSVGTNLIGVLPGASDENGPPATAFGSVITTLKYDDAVALAKKSNVPYAVAVAPYVKGTGTVTWQSHSLDTNFSGTSASYIEVEEGAKVISGRFFNLDEEKNLARVAVLGSEVRDKLFEQNDPIDQQIKIKNETFKVIGVMEPRGVSGFQNQDDQIFIPVSTAQKLLLGINYLGFIRVRVDSVDNIPQTIEDVKATLRYQHNIKKAKDDDFSVRSATQMLDVFGTVTSALSLFLTAVAAISLLVGGIGIMNIMLVAVTERIREIGLRKAVGATRRDLLEQFLIETVIITSFAGLLGLILGIVFSFLVAMVAQYLGYAWDFVVPVWSIILSFGIAVIIGFLFGLYPAYQAAKLDPVVALRKE